MSQDHPSGLHETLLGIACGDERAFNVFYDAFYDRIFRYVFIRTGYDEHATKDLVQQVMLRVVRYVKPVSTEAELWKWLTMTCRSVLADAYRDRVRRNETAIDDQLTDVEDESDTPPELLGALELAMTRLPAEEVELLQSYYFQEIPQSNLAERLGCTVKAVEMRLARLRQKLKCLVLEHLHP